MKNKAFLVGGLAIVGGSLLFACAAPTDESEESSADELTKAFAECKNDSDCVAVPEIKCCPHGELVAVNKAKQAAYEATQSPVCNMMCAQFIKVDTRVPICGNPTKTGLRKCKMVECASGVTLSWFSGKGRRVARVP